MSEKKRKSLSEDGVDSPKRSKTSPENSTEKKPLLSGKEHENLKRFLRERKKFLMRQPHFELTAVGQAAAKGDWGGSSSSEAIMASDVQRLLLYLMMGDKMQDAEIG